LNRRLWSTKEGVGETSGQTAGSFSKRVRSFENRSGRRNKFSSFGADPCGPQFHRRSNAQVKSGPDVFADALVLLKPQPKRRGVPISPDPRTRSNRPRLQAGEAGIAALAAGLQLRPAAGPAWNVARMVIVVRIRTVNQIRRTRENPVKQRAWHFHG
jgi:hypothetical protein